MPVYARAISHVDSASHAGAAASQTRSCISGWTCRRSVASPAVLAYFAPRWTKSNPEHGDIQSLRPAPPMRFFPFIGALVRDGSRGNRVTDQFKTVGGMDPVVQNDKRPGPLAAGCGG